jgi:MFS family permease
MFRAVFAMTATQALVVAPLFAIAVAAPEIAAELGTTPSRIGLFTGSAFAVSVVSTVIGGNAAAHFGGLRVSQACLVFSALAMIFAILDGWWGLAVAALLLGLGLGPETPASSHLLSRIVPPHRRARLFSVRQTGNQIGGILASLLVPAVAVGYGWRASLALLAAGCALYAVVLEFTRRALRYVDVPARIFRPTAASSLRLVRHDKRLRRLALAAFSFCGMQACLNGFLVSYAVEDVGMTLVGAGLLLSAAQAGGLIGRLGWGFVADRLGAVVPVLLGLGVAMSAAAIATAGFASAWPPVALYAVSFVFGLTASGWNGIFLAEVARASPDGRVAEVTGGVQVIAYSGLVVAPLAVSAMVGFGGGYGGGFLFVAALTLAGTILLWRGARSP